MPSEHQRAVNAAANLAKKLSLPAWKGSVFAWRDDGGERLVVSAEESWLATRTSIPATFQGYRVEIRDKLVATAHH